MRETIVHFFSDKEESIISLLAEIGVRRNAARVLVCLSRQNAATSREIGLLTDLRPSDVSIAVRELVARGWVRVVTESPSCRGRPRKIYSLPVTIPAIIASVVSERNRGKPNPAAGIGRMKEFC